MAVNVLGGSLEFDAILTTDGLDASMASIQASIRNLVDEYEKLSAAGDGIGAGLQNASQDAKNFGALMLNVSKETGQAFDVKEVNKFASAIQLANEVVKPLLGTLAQNVGADKISELAASLEKVNDDGKALQITLKFIKDNIGALNLDPQGAQALNAAISQLQQTFGGLSTQTDTFASKTSSAFSQLRALKNQMATEGQDNPAFEKDLESAEQLENRIKNVNKLLELTGKNTSGLAALGEATKAVIGGFEAWNGILGLISSSDEQVEKTIKNVVSAMGVLNGIQEVSAALDKRSELNIFLLEQVRKLTAKTTEEQAVATEVLAAAQETEAVATEGATVAQVELNTAMEANPAGILLLAITGIVIALQAFASGHKDATEEQIKANEAYAEGAEILNKLAELQKGVFEERTVEANNAVGLAQSQGKSEQAILDLKAKALATEKQANLFALAVLGYSKEEYGILQATLESRLEEQHALVNLKALGGELTKDQEKQLDLLNAQIKSLNAQFEPMKQLVEANKSIDAQIEQNRAESEKRAHDAALKSAQATADSRLLIAKKNTQDELNAEIAAIKARQVVQLNDPNLTAGDRLRINTQAQHDIEEAQRKFRVVQLNDTKDILQAQLDSVKEGSEKELQLRIAMAENAGQIELAQEGVTGAKKVEIAAATNKKINDLTKQFALQNAEADVETRIAGIDTELAAVQKGTEKELDLKKQRIDQEAALNILQVQDRGKNEELLVARILAINAAANVQKKKLDDDYYDHLRQRQLQIIENQSNEKKADFQAIINNPFSGPLQVFQAQRASIEEEISATKKEIDIVQRDINQHHGNAQILDQQITALQARLKKLEADNVNLGLKFNQDQLKRVASGISSIAGALGSMGSNLQGVNSDLANFVSGLSKAGDFASKAISAAASFASGPQGIVSGITSTIGALSDLFSLIGGQNAGLTKQQIAELQNQVIIGEIEVTRQYEQRVVDQAKLNKLRLQGIQEETSALQQQAKTTQQQFDDLLGQIQKEKGQKLVDNPAGGAIGSLIPQLLETFSLQGLSFDQLNELFLKGELSDKAKELFEELQKLKQAGADIDQALADAKDQLDQVFTGTTADDIASSIIDGFKQGKRSVADFASDFHDLMLNAMLSALESQTLEPALQEFYDQFAAFGQSDGLLTSDEIDQLQKQYNDILKNAAEKFDQLQQIAGINLGGQSATTNSLSGAIKGITEDQAELLAGQFGGLRVTAMDQLNMATRQFQVLQDIQRDTSNLPEMKDILRYFKLNGIKITS